MFSMFRISVQFLRVALMKRMKWARCRSAMTLTEAVKKYAKSPLRLSYHQFF